MSCCTSKILKRCESVPVCSGTLVLPYDTLLDGEYIIVLNFLGSQIRIPVTAAEGKILLPLADLNECYYYEGYVLNSDGGALQLIDDEHDAFAFTTALVRTSAAQQLFIQS